MMVGEDMKKTTLKKPNPIIFGILKIGSWFLNTFYYRLKIERNDLRRAGKGRKVIICNHESKIDFYSIYQATKGRPHMVVSNSFLRSMKIGPLMKSIGCIGKNQFQTSVADMRAMRDVLDNDRQLIFYPAGLMAEIGLPTPIPKATGKTVKWFDADIYVGKVSGTYLSNPKWAKIKRRGKVTLNVYKLFTREQLATLPAEEVHKAVCDNLYFNAYADNLSKGVEFKNGDNLEGLENVLYKCPNCKEEFTVRAKGNVMFCDKCGYSVLGNKVGTLTQNGDIPLVYQMPNNWYNFIEEGVMKEVEMEGFKLFSKAEFHKINDKKHCFEYVGEGTIALDKENFYLNGKLYGERFEKTIYAQNFPILPFIPGKHFEVQDGKDIYRVYLEKPEQTMRWILALKQVYRLANK